jgi:hypothetical protein
MIIFEKQTEEWKWMHNQLAIAQAQFDRYLELYGWEGKSFVEVFKSKNPELDKFSKYLDGDPPKIYPGFKIEEHIKWAELDRLATQFTEKGKV